ncbi:hypothetical protein V496_08550 [Pseudogymnoascus sp. VKM F-4515 (FW-2607)]|nr:hypothetical protein V496_08550 [Pseudogymnoascus sp. VKM F-4515 (FW-2607)]KFY95069.1 hypothetical protein V498_03541 [Pseudogymnoascus sp. VKM F-4517 (FW-2822)]
MHDHVGKDEMNSSKAGSLAQMEFAIESVKEKSDPIFEIDTALEKQLVRKIDIRLIPVTALVYLLCYLDRSNVGNAKILNLSTGDSLQQTNNMTDYQFTIALMVFLVAYSIFEIPSNLALKALSPNRWISFLVVSFGAFCAGIGGTHNFAGVAALRFFLGAAEAGVFPGLIFYFSFWYKQEERATRIAAFLASATLAGAFGGVLAFGVGHMNGIGGLEAWRWLFIFEGVPAVIVGISLYFFLPSYPETSSWLTSEEKALSTKRLRLLVRQDEDKVNWNDAKTALKTWTLYVHYIIYLGAGVSISSLALFSPTIVLGLGYSDLQAQLFTVPPYAVAYVFTIGFAIISDRYKQRGLIAGVSCFTAGTAFAVSAALPDSSYIIRYIMLIMACTGAFSGLPSLCAWVGDNVRSSTAGSVSTALNIAFSGPGQIIGVWIYRAQDAPFYRLGHAVNAGFMFLSAILSFMLMFYYKRENAKMTGTNERRWIP